MTIYKTHRLLALAASVLLFSACTTGVDGLSAVDSGGARGGTVSASRSISGTVTLPTDDSPSASLSKGMGLGKAATVDYDVQAKLYYTDANGAEKELTSKTLTSEEVANRSFSISLTEDEYANLMDSSDPTQACYKVVVSSGCFEYVTSDCAADGATIAAGAIDETSTAAADMASDDNVKSVASQACLKTLPRVTGNLFEDPTLIRHALRTSSTSNSALQCGDRMMNGAEFTMENVGGIIAGIISDVMRCMCSAADSSGVMTALGFDSPGSLRRALNNLDSMTEAEVRALVSGITSQCPDFKADVLETVALKLRTSNFGNFKKAMATQICGNSDVLTSVKADEDDAKAMAKMFSVLNKSNFANVSTFASGVGMRMGEFWGKGEDYRKEAAEGRGRALLMMGGIASDNFDTIKGDDEMFRHWMESNSKADVTGFTTANQLRTMGTSMMAYFGQHIDRREELEEQDPEVLAEFFRQEVQEGSLTSSNAEDSGDISDLFDSMQESKLQLEQQCITLSGTARENCFKNIMGYANIAKAELVGVDLDRCAGDLEDEGDGDSCGNDSDWAAMFDGNCENDQLNYSYEFLLSICDESAARCYAQYACEQEEDSCIPMALQSNDDFPCDLSSCGAQCQRDESCDGLCGSAGYSNGTDRCFSDGACSDEWWCHAEEGPDCGDASCGAGETVDNCPADCEVVDDCTYHSDCTSAPPESRQWCVEGSCSDSGILVGDNFCYQANWPAISETWVSSSDCGVAPIGTWTNGMLFGHNTANNDALIFNNGGSEERIVVYWLYSDDGSLHYKKYTVAGGWTSAAPLPVCGDSLCKSLKLLKLSDSSAVLFYSKYSNPSSDDLYAIPYTVAGGWGAAVQVSDENTRMLRQDIFQAVGAASMGSGKWVVSWHADVGYLKARIYDAGFGEIASIGSPEVGLTAYYPTVRANANGQIVVNYGWNISSVPSRLYVYSGGIWSRIILPANINVSSFASDVAITSTGKVVAIYSRFQNAVPVENRGLFARVYDIATDTWDAEITLDDDTFMTYSSGTGPSIISDSNDNVTAVWGAYSTAGAPWNSGMVVVYKARRLVAGVWDGAATVISSSAIYGGSTNPSLAVGANNDVYVLATGGVADSLHTNFYIAHFDADDAITPWDSMSLGYFASGYPTQLDIANFAGTDRLMTFRGEMATYQLGISGLSIGELCSSNGQCTSGGCNSNVCAAVCGNGLSEAGEQCDDGGTANGDGCSSTCQNEGGGGDTCDSLCEAGGYDDPDICETEFTGGGPFCQWVDGAWTNDNLDDLACLDLSNPAQHAICDAVCMWDNDLGCIECAGDNDCNVGAGEVCVANECHDTCEVQEDCDIGDTCTDGVCMW